VEKENQEQKREETKETKEIGQKQLQELQIVQRSKHQHQHQTEQIIQEVYQSRAMNYKAVPRGERTEATVVVIDQFQLHWVDKKYETKQKIKTVRPLLTCTNEQHLSHPTKFINNFNLL
tara:strand:+ start:337 stop:693 length:357 start_codon:yes stop_codon:yes gene_type:complete